MRFLIKSFLLSLALLLPFSTMAAVIGVNNYTYNGQTRSYAYVLPTNYNQLKGIVILLHGFSLKSGMGSQTSPGRFFIDTIDANNTSTNLLAQADTNRYLIIAPDALLIGDSGGSTNPAYAWKAGACCSNPALDSGVDDIGFINTLIDDLISSANSSWGNSLSRSKVAVIGASNGGIMAHALHCSNQANAGALLSIASVSGSLVRAYGTFPLYSCSAAHASNIYQILGDSDTVIPYSGGSISIYPNPAPSYWSSGPAQAAGQVTSHVTTSNALGCSSSSTDPNSSDVYINMPPSASGRSYVNTYSYQSSCPAGKSARRSRFAGQGHADIFFEQFTAAWLWTQTLLP